MLRWTILRQHANVLRRPCPTLLPYRRPHFQALGVSGARWFTSTIRLQAEHVAGFATSERFEPLDLSQVDPRRRADAWLALLEPSLPLHLRERDHIQDGLVLSPTEIFKVLKNAQKESHSHYATDILSYIAHERGRWNLVVWLVKHLVESFGEGSRDSDTSLNLLCTWKNDLALDELTRDPVDLQRSDFLQHVTIGREPNITLDDGMQRLDRDGQAGDAIVKHDAWGMIWRSLGNMTVACAEGEIRPEILEIIAFLHHQGFMPSTIYDSKPSPDPTAIQQSPILNLLSSRILTSLSDAAWRAHEKLVVEEAKARSGEDLVSRPEISGTAYRVRVAGLKPEVWLELILWSCLHGGCVGEGIEILRKLHNTRNDQQWRPLSWRSLVSKHPKDTRDWERVEYLFNNWALSSMDPEEPVTPVPVHRTVSSEVINAYVDASISVMRASTRGQGRSVSQTIEFVITMQRFLGRSGLGLGAGSWDAIILRLFDSQDTAMFRPRIFDKVIGLSPTMGQEISATNIRSLPDYVFDGTAAVFGLFHRALYHRIREADVEGALRLFASLQERADENKRRSVVDFLEKRQLFAKADEQSSTEQFTDNYASIDYPAFYIQIPPSILGPFMELVTNAKAYDFGKWLLYSEEIDGPIIPQSLYGDPSITPALVRFAAETGDKELLSRLIKVRAAAATKDEPTLPRKVLQSFLESQITLMRWEAVVKILQHMKDIYALSWNCMTLCHLIRVSLLQVRSAEEGDKTAVQNLGRARGLFRQLIRGGYERRGERPDYVQEQVDNLLVILARIGRDWTGFSVNTQAVNGYRVFNLPSKAFNLVLEGVVDAYGSHAGRKLIGDFWSHEVRRAQEKESPSDKRATDPPFSSFGRTLPEHIRRQRSEIRFPGTADRKVITYAGLRPDLMTIRIVLKKAIEEFVDSPDAFGREAEGRKAFVDSPSELAEADVDDMNEHEGPEIDATPAGMVVWGVQCLKRLGMTVEDIGEELRQSLPRSKLNHILESSPDLLTPVGEQEEESGQDTENGNTDAEGATRNAYVPIKTFDG